MRFGRLLQIVFIWGVAGGAASANIVSYTGTLATPETVVDFSVTLPDTGLVTLQTYGFGGGTNAAGTVISAGGTDPFLAIFSGTGSSASIITDAFSNAFGTSVDLSTYGSFTGCPPAGAPVIGGSPQCGDINMALTLSAGTYTVILTDGQNIAGAVFDNGTLGEGFTDLTGGVFCNLNINGAGCPNTSGAYALDIGTPTPEPAVFGTVGGAALGLWFAGRRRKNHNGSPAHQNRPPLARAARQAWSWTAGAAATACRTIDGPQDSGGLL